MTDWDVDNTIKAMKVTIGRTSERFAANLEQLKKESTDQIRRSFDSIVTLKDFLSELLISVCPDLMWLFHPEELLRLSLNQQ